MVMFSLLWDVERETSKDAASQRTWVSGDGERGASNKEFSVDGTRGYRPRIRDERQGGMGRC